VALAEDLQIQCQHQGGAAHRLGPSNQAIDEVAIAHDVELEPERLVDALGDVLDRADAHG
jgi:transketolase C-terminal domain/subunit